MNTIVISGRLTAEPELKKTSGGTDVCSFAVAVRRDKEHTDFLDCVAWKNNAVFVTQYFRKGDPIEIKGSLNTRTWEDKQGNKRKAVEIFVEQATFTVSKKAETQEQAPQPQSQPQPQQTVPQQAPQQNQVWPDFKDSRGATDGFEQVNYLDEDLPF